uniref:DUF504 domain-containing protein n=1 Tax=Methanothrix sp. TaxID=90426 RepID=UPI0034E2C20D
PKVFSLRKSHEILLRLKFDPAYTFEKAVICYTDRGAPGDTSCVVGEEITELAGYYFESRREGAVKRIPYHRIKRITYEGRVLWEAATRR